jgi:hypothetical protein
MTLAVEICYYLGIGGWCQDFNLVCVCVCKEIVLLMAFLLFILNNVNTMCVNENKNFY